MTETTKRLLVTLFRIVDTFILLTFPLLLIISINFLYNTNIEMNVRNWLVGAILLVAQAIIRVFIKKDPK